MDNRESKNTCIDNFAVRKKVWDDAIESAKNHIGLAKTFQMTGVKILKKLQGITQKEGVDQDQISKMYQQILVNIEKGTKIERDARKELNLLLYRKPRNKE
ncbi:MAG: hypothetical protein DRH26_11630 [Deltaproteobacteria bacterium]|nr:MAG: hypothetical protein DRH26_11630 [Deltaproteobacteria bacterium]